MGRERNSGSACCCPADKNVIIDLLLHSQEAQRELKGWRKKRKKRVLRDTQKEQTACQWLAQHLTEKFCFGNGVLFGDEPFNIDFWKPLLETYPVAEPILNGFAYAHVAEPFRQLLEVCCDAQVETIDAVARFCHDIIDVSFDFLKMNYLVN